MIDAFVSYSRKDKLKVKLVFLHLQQSMLRVWYDEDLSAGQKFGSEISGKLKRASCVIVVHSEHSAQSDWVRAETLFALKNNKVVIPILLDDTPLPPHLSAIDGIDLRDWNDASFHPQIAQLVRDIRLHLRIGDNASRNLSGAPGLKSKPAQESQSGCLQAFSLAFVAMLLFVGIARECKHTPEIRWVTPSELHAIFAADEKKGVPVCDTAKRVASADWYGLHSTKDVVSRLLSGNRFGTEPYAQALYNAGCLAGDWQSSSGKSLEASNQQAQTYPPFFFDVSPGVDWADLVQTAFSTRNFDLAFDVLEKAAPTDARAKGLLGVMHALKVGTKAKPEMAFRVSRQPVQKEAIVRPLL